jgi:hypothetical protein
MVSLVTLSGLALRTMIKTIPSLDVVSAKGKKPLSFSLVRSESLQLQLMRAFLVECYETRLPLFARLLAGIAAFFPSTFLALKNTKRLIAGQT